MESWIKDIKYVLMPARRPLKTHENDYFAAYHVWKSAWEKFRAEIGVKEPLRSDGFVLPDEIGALFYKEECVGLSAFTFGSLKNGPTADLSWFSGWTPRALRHLSTISTNVMIGSQFTVSPKFTGKDQIVRWKEIVFLFTFMRFYNSSADVMAGHLNLTRKVNEACGEDFGATVLEPCQNFNYYGVEIPAQLVAYKKENIFKMKNKLESIAPAEELWEHLIHLTDNSVTSNDRYLKAA